MSNSKLNVLIVEDEEIMSIIMADMFDELSDNFVVDCVISITGALRKLSEKRFDLITMDMNLMGMPTLGLIDKIRRELPHTQIILATSYQRLSENSEMRGIPRLIKPFSLEDLRAVIKKVIPDLQLKGDSSG